MQSQSSCRALVHRWISTTDTKDVQREIIRACSRLNHELRLPTETLVLAENRSYKTANTQAVHWGVFEAGALWDDAYM